MHTSIQQSHESFQLTLQEVLTTIGQHQQPHQQQRQHQRRDEHVIEDDEDMVDENPFAPLQAQVNRPRNWDRGPMVEDRRWENGFKSDLPEFTGSIRGEELVDWLVTVEEIIEFKQLVSRFIGGLRPQLQNALEQIDPNTVAEAHRRAASFERQSRSSSTNWNSSARFRNTTSQDQTTGQGLNNTNPETTRVPASNRAATSTEEQTLRRSSRPNVLRCFTCGELGHIQTACPNKLKRGLLIEEIDPTYDDYHDDNGDELGEDAELEGDSGPLLVARRICLAPQVLEEPWLRTNILQSTCTVKGKVYSFIIDSGSCHNIVSDYAVRKLSLEKEAHPHPYKLTWLKAGTEVRVTHRSLVSFSIGAIYKDKIYCDVVPMDVGHLIFGRPWQYDPKQSLFSDFRGENQKPNLFLYLPGNVRLKLSINPFRSISAHVFFFFNTSAHVYMYVFWAYT
uniref:CCHC-type domain-containing protein n=1 Tax=Brassica oleracea var. oleracea TaxID=109376 RepID=A0A0D3DVW3_BRAOL